MILRNFHTHQVGKDDPQVSTSTNRRGFQQRQIPIANQVVRCLLQALPIIGSIGIVTEGTRLALWIPEGPLLSASKKLCV